MRHWILRGAMLLLIFILLSYMTMAFTARRLIAPGEYAIYTHAILRAALGHADEGGGIRALGYTQESLAHPLTDDQIAGAATVIAIPMPPHTTRQTPTEAARGHQYVSFVTDAEFISYITQTLPQAGWMHVDQMGASHFFIHDRQQVIISRRYLLSAAISELQISMYP